MGQVQVSKIERQQRRAWLIAVGLSAVVAVGLFVSNRSVASESAAFGDDSVDDPGQTEGDDHNHDDHHHPSRLDENGRFSGPGGAWPPEPANATERESITLTDIGPDDPNDALASLTTRTDSDNKRRASPSESIMNVVRSDGRVQELLSIEALGSAQLISAEGSDDGEEEALNLIYFINATSQTLWVTMVDDEVSEVDLSNASEFQPPVSPSEHDRAVAIAREYWNDQPGSEVEGLEGFTILAFKPDGSYYDTRMVYVSFHVDVDAQPELITWVDLGNGSIHKAGVDR